MQARNNSRSINSKARQIKISQILTYNLPVIIINFFMGTVTIIQGIYVKYFGMTLANIATVILIARIFDAVSDPIIGYLSDRYYSRTGSRKLFVGLGAILFLISTYFLCVPFDTTVLQAHDAKNIGQVTVSTSYFLFCFILFYLAFTLFEVPHLAWASELAYDSKEKTTIFGCRALAIYSGALLFYAVPLLPVFESNEFSPETLEWSVWVAGLIMLPLLLACLINTPNVSSICDTKNYHLEHAKGSNYPRFSLRLLFKSWPFLLFMMAFNFFGVGFGMWFGMWFLLVDSYFNLGSHFALITMLGFALSIVSTQIWNIVLRKYGKKVAWCGSLLLTIIGFLGLGYCVFYGAGVNALLLISAIIYSGLIAGNMIAPSLLSEIVDYNNWKFKSDFTASYFAIYTLTIKASAAVGVAAGMGIATLYEFDPSQTIHSQLVAFGLGLVVSWLPALSLLVCLALVTLIPMNSRRHMIILRRRDST